MNNSPNSRIIVPIALLCLTIPSFSQLIQVPGMSITASSELKSTNHAYSADKALDGNPATAWVEGAEGSGDGEWLELRFLKPTEIDGIALMAGYRKNFSSLENNLSPDHAEVIVNNESLGELAIRMPRKYDEKFSCIIKADSNSLQSYSVLIFPKRQAVETIKVKFFVTGASGAKFKDLAISEITPIIPKTTFGSQLDLAIQALLTIRDQPQNLKLWIYSPASTASIALPHGIARTNRWVRVDPSTRSRVSIDTELSTEALTKQEFKWTTKTITADIFHQEFTPSLIGVFNYISSESGSLKIIGDAAMTADIEAHSESNGSLQKFPGISITKALPVRYAASYLRIKDEPFCDEIPKN